MRKPTQYASFGATTAIAAALALVSTPLLAQQAPPTTTDPTPPVSAQPAPSLDVPSPTTDTIATPSTATESTSVSTTTTSKAKRTVHTAAKPVPVTMRTASRTTTTRVAHAAVPAAAATPPLPASPTAAAPAKPAPIVDLTAKPAAQPAPVPAKATPAVDNTTVMFGGGALALLALGGGAYALARRKRHEDDAVYEETYEPEAMAPAPEAQDMPRHDPVVEEQPAIVAPSAFAWHRQPATESEDDGSDLRPGETWIERAHRGPSPANPSVSLKSRLKRAAFFDKRERDVAAGKAEPVEADAGLPEAAIEEQERELA